MLPKLLWLREHEPESYAACRSFLMPLDYLTQRLTGIAVTDHSMASGTMCYDLSSRAWSDEILSRLGLESDKLPEIRQAGEVVGTLRAEAAEALGLPRSVKVVLGGQDQKMAALAAGLELDRGTLSLGTAMAVTQHLDAPVLDPGMRIPCFSDVRAGRWVLEGSSGCCSILDWLRQTFFPSSSHEELNRLAAEAPGHSALPIFLPFFPSAPALFGGGGVLGGLHGLDLATTPGAIVRSLYESIAFVVRSNLEVMGGIARPVRALRAFGGGSRSDLWCRIIADVCRLPIEVLGTAECAAMGAAILAGSASGVFPTAADGARRMAVRVSYAPRAELAEACEKQYRRFRELCATLAVPEGGHRGG